MIGIIDHGSLPASSRPHGHTSPRGHHRPQRHPPPQPPAHVRQPPGLRRVQEPPDPVRPVPDRPVGAPRAVRGRDHPDGQPPASRGPLHAQGGLGPARVPGDAPPLRPGAPQGGFGLAQRLRLVEHRDRALLRRVLRPDREPQPDRVRGRLQRGRDRAADRDRATSGRSRARSRPSSSTPPATTSTSRSRRSWRRPSGARSRRAGTR